MKSKCVIQNHNISAVFDLCDGISIVSIYDKINCFEFLEAPSPLFKYSINDSCFYASNSQNQFGIRGVVVTDRIVSDEGQKVMIHSKTSYNEDIEICILIYTGKNDNELILRASLINNTSRAISVKLTFPAVKNMTVPGFEIDPARMIGAVPQEIAGATPLIFCDSIGMTPPSADVHLPSSMNTMQTCGIYDRDGHGGIYFTDITGCQSIGITPIQFIVKKGMIQGRFADPAVASGSKSTLPELALGVHQSGCYEAMVDSYIKAHKAFLKPPDTPAWLKESGGIWCAGGAGSGGAYMIWGYMDLGTLISSFDDLPLLFDQAQAAGTNILYLTDYWEGDVKGYPAHYWNKGDYIPRADLGGSDALIRGIKNVRSRGGKVIFYLEPFIAHINSDIGIKRGKELAAYRYDGSLYETYHQNYSMLAPSEEWQDHLIDVCKRLITEYDADGIFLDSYGYQFNASVTNHDNSKTYTPNDWNTGVYNLIDRVRNAALNIKKDFVVLCESASGELFMHQNGGSSADFVWQSASNNHRVTASPVRYGLPFVNFFTNGSTMNHLAQVYASGHSLALNPKWNTNARFIKRLLDIRREYKDAIIYGSLNQPVTRSNDVGVYCYTGKKNKVIMVVNTTSGVLDVCFTLPWGADDGLFTELLSGDVYHAAGNMMRFSIPGAFSDNFGLIILVK